MKETVGISSFVDGSWLDGEFEICFTEESIDLAEKTTAKNLIAVRLRDVAGCRIFDSGNPHRAFLTLVFYTKEFKNIPKKACRKKNSITIFYEAVTADEVAMETAEKWKSEIIERSGLRARKFLIILNPVCGSGKSAKVFAEQVAPMIREANCDFTLIETEYSGHAKVLMKNHVDLNHYDAIVAASGDGLLHEIVNGIFSRSDVDEILKIPLGLLPLGSANALSAMICHKNGEGTINNCIVQATFLLLKSLDPKPLNVMAIDTGKGRLFSPLWFAWGLISDVDIESEYLRWLGSLRFTIQTLIRVINLRKYKGRLSFLPVGEFGEISPLSDPVPNSWIQIDGEFTSVIATRSSHLANTLIFNPEISTDDNSIWLGIHRSENVNRSIMLSHFRAMGQGQGVGGDVAGIEWYQVSAFRLEPDFSDNQKHLLTVDGEQIESGPVQAELLEKTASILY